MNNLKQTFEKPNVSHVFALMEQAARHYQLSKWEEVHRLLGTSERTFRRWKKHVDTQPSTASPIGFQSYALLYALAFQKPLFAPLCHVEIPSELIMNAQTFADKGISKEQVRSLIGLKSRTGLSLKVIANAVGVTPTNLSNQINLYNNEKVSFATWAMILMCCGVAVKDIF